MHELDTFRNNSFRNSVPDSEGRDENEKGRKKLCLTDVPSLLQLQRGSSLFYSLVFIPPFDPNSIRCCASEQATSNITYISNYWQLQVSVQQTKIFRECCGIVLSQKSSSHLLSFPFPLCFSPSCPGNKPSLSSPLISGHSLMFVSHCCPSEWNLKNGYSSLCYSVHWLLCVPARSPEKWNELESLEIWNLCSPRPKIAPLISDLFTTILYIIFTKKAKKVAEAEEKDRKKQVIPTSSFQFTILSLPWIQFNERLE